MFRVAALRKRQRYQQLMDEMDEQDRLAALPNETEKAVHDSNHPAASTPDQHKLVHKQRSEQRPFKRRVAPRPPPRRSLFAVFVTTLFVALAVRVLRTKTGPPRNYALCSTENAIYTVDERKPRVECIVIHGNSILDTGTLGE
jgi:hypothetical protein